MRPTPGKKGRPAPKPTQILLSKRANVFYLEHARVQQKDGRMVYQTQSGEDVEQFFNIPHQNTTLLLLGKGTSITDSAMRALAEASVIVGFTGAGGSPLLTAVDPVFLAPQSEYRPTEYMQGWMRMWLDDAKRLSVAKNLLRTRLQWAEEGWASDKALGQRGIAIAAAEAERFEARIRKATRIEELLSAEGDWVKSLYRCLAQGYRIQDFVRDESAQSRERPADTVNGMLTHGNYVAYGYAAVALYALGISFALPVLHGKTRRGALVFDIADLFKDWTVLPLAFAMTAAGERDQAYREALIERLHKLDVLDRVIETIKKQVL